MSGLDISEKRLPQDGRFNVKVREQPVDVRISTMPTQYGESVVMRLLNRNSGLLGARAPRHAGRHARALHARSSAASSGMVLVTGPTGSGKTTTLYAALNELNTPDAQDHHGRGPGRVPRCAGINQVQVNEKIELTFARVLRSALRQDPDVILVGEMRDTGDRADRPARRADRPHGVLDAAHQRRG